MSNPPTENPFVRDFQTRIADAAFPCVGAKTALSQQSLSFVLAADLRSARDDHAIVRQLQAFAAEAAADTLFVTRVVLFTATPQLDEIQFEQALWQRLQALHVLDAGEHDWDPDVSSDPENPSFSLSLGGRAFYVIGLHPGASRAARRFGCAALVFNLHSQFETLRAQNRYDRVVDVITRRDIAYSGSRNPMLAKHGVTSEARQYSGRQVDGAWRCPFSAMVRPGMDIAANAGSTKPVSARPASATTAPKQADGFRDAA